MGARISQVLSYAVCTPIIDRLEAVIVVSCSTGYQPAMHAFNVDVIVTSELTVS